MVGQLEILLKSGNSPNHVSDRGRREEQTCNGSAEIRLGILEYNFVWLQQRAEAPFLNVGSELFLRGCHKKNSRIGQDQNSQSDPHNVNTYAMLDHRPDSKRSNRTAKHSDTLGDADSGCE